MKKTYFLILLISCIAFNNCKAQYVTIPDGQFAYWLQTNYPNCMNGDQLDTTCNDILTTTTLNIYGLPIFTLSGIEYFKNLDSLDCSNDSLHLSDNGSSYPWWHFPPNLTYVNFSNNKDIKVMPDLPPTLLTLICQHDSIYYNHYYSYLAELPQGLVTLMCDWNQIDSLPKLPPTLQTLSCSNNRLYTFPDFPDSLLYIDISFQFFTNNYLPPLPPALQYLDCRGNGTLQLPELPSTLQTLFCGYNDLIYGLPALPASLTDLYCEEDWLGNLPLLPPQLSTLYCNNNNLDTLPILPATLTTLNCGHNYLTSLPILPPELLNLDCGNNQLTSLPQFPPTLGNLVCNYNQLTTLPPFPPNLWSISCYFNNLSALPDLPDFVYYLYCEYNPNLTCLPELKTITYLTFTGTGVTCLPDYGTVTHSQPPLASLPLCGIFDNNCASYWNISGRCYYDSNSNCNFDGNDVGTGYVKTQLYKSGVLQEQMFTGGEGFYSFDAVAYGNYKVQVDTTNLPFVVSCPGTGNYADTITSADSLYSNNNFAFKCRTEGFDIGVQSIINEGGIARPAAPVYLKVTAGDISQLYGAHCAMGISGQVQLTFAGDITYTGAASGALTPDNVNSNTLTWNIADFGAINSFTEFNSLFKIDNNAIAGSSVCFTINVTPANGDYNQDNNTASYCFTIVNALDPNEKEVSPTGYLQSTNQWLTYTIRFQNTGTAPALNVRITDTLDSNLDPSTFQLLTYSAKNLTQIFGNFVTFNFPNINLPDSTTSDSASRGYIQYKIKMRNNLPPGTPIKNTANIYFDLNPAIRTNTTHNNICSSTLIDTTVTITCGDSVTINSHAYYLSGNYTDTLQSSQGCDSIVTLRLTSIGDTIDQYGGLCGGDSIYFFGRYIYTPGYYDTILPSATGCDTFATLTLVAIDPLPPMHIYDTICSGDSVAFNGGFVYTTGVYTAHYNPQNGCDSAVVLNLTVNELPVVTFSWDSLVALGFIGYYYPYTSGSDTVLMCHEHNNFALLGASPSGGHYSGMGVSNDTFSDSNFDFNNTNIIVDTITYTYFDNNQCSQRISRILIVSICEGITEVNANTLFTLYPNPAKDYVTIETDLSAIGGALQITDVTGRTLDRLQVTSSKLQVNTNQFSAGIYFVRLSDKQGRNATMKLVIQ